MSLSIVSLDRFGEHAAAAGGAVSVDFDVTLVIHAALFIFLLAVLKPVLFDPMLKLFAEREKATIGTDAEAQKIDQRSADALRLYETGMGEARAKAAVERDRLRAGGLKEEASILAEARAEVAARVDAARKKNEAEAAAVRAFLDADLAQIAKAVASKGLGRDV